MRGYVAISYVPSRIPRSLLWWLSPPLLCAALLALSNFNGIAERPHTELRWLMRSRAYKAKVLASSTAAPGELRHIEWNGWGGFGAGDTVEYLVFDPSDSLQSSAKNRSQSSRLPCEVARVHRLESGWYTVLFYTDTDWSHCQ